MSFHDPQYDAIISGAGPVGLFLACELALRGCTVLILEKSDQPQSPLKRLPFGLRGLNAPSVEAFYRRGLLDDLTLHKKVKDPHQHAVKGPRRMVGHFAGIPFQEGNIDPSRWTYRLPGSPEAMLLSEMEEVETALTRRAESLGVTILLGHGVTSFEQSPDAVTVQAGNKTFTAQWLAGCDGSRSVVRKLAGIEFAGTEPEFTGYSAHVDLAGPEKLQPGRNVTERGMYLQSQPGYLVIQDFDGGAFHGGDQAITREHLQEVLRRISGKDVTITQLHTVTTWTDRARQAVTYRKGRVLLAGDAAHIHAPLGGQGLNLGLGDAMNLGWKLAATLQGHAPEGLLDTYEAERHPIGAQVLDWSRAQVLAMRPDPHSRALYAILRDLIDTPDGATYMAGRVWGIATKYDLGGDHPLVGASTPNFEFGNGSTIGEKLRDGRGILLDFAGNPALQQLALEYRALQYVSAQAREQFGLDAVLIRPDGVIAAVQQASIQQKVGLWFARETL